MSLFRTHKPRPEFGATSHAPKQYSQFIPIPVPQPVNCTLPLTAILGADRVNAIQASGQIVFHTIGDTGGINGTDVQDAIAEAMEAQYQDQNNSVPSFFYHLGDVIYYNGQSSLYDSQFYEPYKYYPGVIFAIPGNHDGDTQVRSGDAPDTEPSLYGFFQNFCAPQRTPISTYRDAITQPYVYWTLKAPFITIIGLYGNVDGNLDGSGTVSQQQWFTSQLQQADQSTCIIVAVHQPPYSLDSAHGGYPPIEDAINQAAQEAGVWPHAVFSGHVHDYQRFTRHINIGGQTRDIPYLIAGAGGYANVPRLLHKLSFNGSDTPISLPFQTQNPEVELRNYNESEPGFLRVTVTDTRLKAEYFTVPFTGPTQATLFDSMTLNYKSGTIEQG